MRCGKRSATATPIDAPCVQSSVLVCVRFGWFGGWDKRPGRRGMEVGLGTRHGGDDKIRPKKEGR